MEQDTNGRVGCHGTYCDAAAALFNGIVQRSQELAHFSRGVKIALDAGGRDAIAENCTSFVDSPEPHELLAGHEERWHIGWVVARQLGESRQAGIVIALLIEFHRETVAQKGVTRVVCEHGFDLFAARHWTHPAG